MWTKALPLKGVMYCKNTLRNDWPGSSSAEKEQVILVGIKQKVSQKHALAKAANSILSCINTITVCRSSKMLIPLYSSV